MLNWISSACIVLAGQAGPLYVNTTISVAQTQKIMTRSNPTTLDGLSSTSIDCECRSHLNNSFCLKWIHCLDSSNDDPRVLKNIGCNDLN